MLILQTHILPVSCSEGNHENQAAIGDQGLINQGYGYWSEHKKQPYAWFTDQINQVSSQKSSIPSALIIYVQPDDSTIRV